MRATVLAWMLVAAEPSAEAQPNSPEAALEYARNAFEYRDFEKVVDVLWPWLHPPRFVDPERAVAARELLGVALHLLGRVDDGKEEFAALLLRDPDHELDPFVVPPDIIQSFQDVQERMEPALRALRDREPVEPSGQDPAPPPRVRVEWVEVPDPAVAFLPFGAPQFILDAPEWGVLWLLLQTGSIGLNVGAYAAGDALQPGAADRPVWLGVQYGALGAAVLSYVASIVQANGLVLRRRTEILQRSAPSERGRPAGASRERFPRLPPGLGLRF